MRTIFHCPKIKSQPADTKKARRLSIPHGTMSPSKGFLNLSVTLQHMILNHLDIQTIALIKGQDITPLFLIRLILRYSSYSPNNSSFNLSCCFLQSVFILILGGMGIFRNLN